MNTELFKSLLIESYKNNILNKIFTEEFIQLINKISQVINVEPSKADEIISRVLGIGEEYFEIDRIRRLIISSLITSIIPRITLWTDAFSIKSCPRTSSGFELLLAEKSTLLRNVSIDWVSQNVEAIADFASEDNRTYLTLRKLQGVINEN